jgi:hypothetical protein
MVVVVVVVQTEQDSDHSATSVKGFDKSAGPYSTDTYLPEVDKNVNTELIPDPGVLNDAPQGPE